jgi:hypothetical protein
MHSIPRICRTRHLLSAVVALSLVSGAGLAQAPETGPLLLRLPSSARAAALGNAWVAGRDEDVVFHNPAQLVGLRPSFNVSLARFAPGASSVSFASAYAGGPWSLTVGWGVQALVYSARIDARYPFAPDELTVGGQVEGTGALATVGAAIVLKGFRVGLAGKYATDQVAVPLQSLALLDHPTPDEGGHGAFFLDAGLARNLLSGVAAVAVQNIGSGQRISGRTLDSPLQTAIGWSTGRPMGELDVGIAGQVTLRGDWVSPAGGIEAGYAWIDGFSAALRLGVRRPDTDAERPLNIGASFTGDRLTLDYALQMFDGGSNVHRVTVRWR